MSVRGAKIRNMMPLIGQKYQDVPNLTNLFSMRMAKYSALQLGTSQSWWISSADWEQTKMLDLFGIFALIAGIFAHLQN